MSWIIVRQFPVWFKGPKESVRSSIAADSNSSALSNLNNLITQRQQYIDNLPTQVEMDAVSDSQSELGHAKRHLESGVMATDDPACIAQQKQRCLEILDGLGDI